MTLADICFALIAVGATAYLVLGGADFGGGFWDLTAGGVERGWRVRAMVQRSMGPVWETNHVWLIFVVVVSWTAFPVAFGSAFSTLYVALFIAVAGIVLRGTAFALRGEAATISEARVLGGAFALSSVIVPFCLGAAAGGIASGRVPFGNAAGDAFSSWLNPTSITIGALAVLTSAFLAAAYMAADARRSRLDDLEDAFRTRALLAGAGTAVVAVVSIPVVRGDTRFLYDGLTHGRGLACMIVAAVAGVATLALTWLRRFDLARFAAALTAACVVLGWALAQHPYLLPRHLTVGQAAAPHATLVAMLVGVALGLVVLIPSLVWLYRLVLEGRLDEPLEPLPPLDRRRGGGRGRREQRLGQRYSPLRTGDHAPQT